MCTPAEVRAGRTIKNPLTGRCIKPYGPTAERESVMARRTGVRPSDGGCHGFAHCHGSRAQVWRGTAYQTSGGLRRADLAANGSGRIVSARARAAALARGPLAPAMRAAQFAKKR